MRLTTALWISHGKVARRMGLGPQSRLDMLRNLVTALVRHERIETTLARADEMKPYAEKEKDLVPKLFKVLAPRFQEDRGSYVRTLQIPTRERDRARMAVIEFRRNPLPPLIAKRPGANEKTLINQLLKGYREEVAFKGASGTGETQASSAA
ncbi:39S ribosomal protein L17, mitochondrial-like isoform X2 [Scyliorhinus canicula]|uniref:39S ribosomal protein L17, mitochondrial-like isoform X2 n=1 Tax=Scyliorhinus canicula TaxID=7830 RepID=UPI0018F76554|nr:39S ribosomal protein L17, mitochondrial-like isoform X2 [Scyliorhinus canicula]XP_038669898.1 39S ribosomal protein L17, mitochondrial-like isoform X2 [Scyliorhinus canicula]